jgi:hypothetical protein
MVTRARPERPRTSQGVTNHRLELTDVAETERAQERPERGGGHHPVGQYGGRRPGPQHVGVVDVGGAGHHGVHQGQDLAPG